MKVSGSFPHDRQLTNNGEAAGNELTISSAMPMLASVCVKAWQDVLYRICICIVFSSPGRELRLREHRSWLLSAPRVKSHCFHLCSPHQRSFVLPQQPTAELLVAHHITPAASSDQNTKHKEVKKGQKKVWCFRLPKAGKKLSRDFGISVQILTSLCFVCFLLKLNIKLSARPWLI